MAYLPEPKVSRSTRWAYAGCPGLGTDDLMRPDYGRGSKVSPGWHRTPAVRTRSKCLESDGIGTTLAKTPASKRHQESYALRCELGERAYAELTGRKAKRQPAKPKVSKTNDRAKATEVVRQKVHSAGASAVVLTDHEMLKALGIKAIGYLD